MGGREITAVCDIWSAYLERLELVKCLLEQFDVNRSGKIEEEELPVLLQELNAGKPAPTEVIGWVFQQSNLTGCGALNGMELARALACWYKWKGKPDPTGDARRLRGYIKMDKELPPPKSSTCTVL